MKTYQVSYEQNGRQWKADINLFGIWLTLPELVAIEKKLIERYGELSNIKIVKEYSDCELVKNESL